MSDQQTPRQPQVGAPVTVADLLAAQDEVISDEEANAEIDIFAAEPAAPVVAPPDAKEPTTPSVRIAIDKAADILRELRGDK